VSVTALTVDGKPGCHLCEVATEIVGTVVAEFPEGTIEIEEIDIIGDPELEQRFGERIPVVYLDDELHAYWRIDASRLRKALTTRLTTSV
jgi:hypothetical protein